MAERALVEDVAGGIIAAVSAEFPGTKLELDFETERDDYEDAFLWLTPSPGHTESDDVNELWGYAIKLVQAAYEEKDVYLVARVRGSVIIRDREYDTE